MPTQFAVEARQKVWIKQALEARAECSGSKPALEARHKVARGQQLCAQSLDHADNQDRPERA